VRCWDAPRQCGRARQTTARDERVRKAQNCGEEKTGESKKAGFVERQGRQRRSVLRHATVSCCKESFHAATVTRAGGERSWISAAVSLWRTLIGAPHLGQSQRSVEFLLSVRSGSVWGAAPSR
jgi:hypothetical protein